MRPGDEQGGKDRPVRLAYLLSQYPAVSHTFLRSEIAGLRSLGFTIEVASINEPGFAAGEDGQDEEAARTFYVKRTSALEAIYCCLRVLGTTPRVWFRGLRTAFGVGSQGLRLSFFYFVEALLVGEWMERNGLRHLHIHFGGPVASVGRIAALAWRLPYSLTIHGPDEFYDEARFHLLEKVKDARFVVCISDFCRSQVMRLVPGSEWGKLVVVRLGVDLARFSSPLAPRELYPVEILCVGRLVTSKGQLILLQAAKRLLDKGLPVHLTLVGDGRWRGELETYVHENSMSAAVHFAGACSHAQVRGMLAEADIFCLPSFAEGVPVALMEAMACSLPVVSTYVAGIPELITNGVDGLLVAPSSVSALEGALERLVRDSSLRGKLGSAGRTTIEQRYSFEPNVEALARLMQKWIGA